MAARRILVAEDDGEIRQALIDMLELSGYTVRSASDGAEALAAIDGWWPDAIVLDMLMPEMDGTAFLEVLRERGGGTIPIVVLSAMRDLAVRVATLPVAAVIAKPFDLEELLGVLEGLWVGERPRPAG